MTKPKEAKPKEATCMFDSIQVQLGAVGRTNVLEPPKSTVVVEPKLILLGSHYKIAWKKVTSITVKEEGFQVESEKHICVILGPQGNDWPLLQKLLQKYWNKQLSNRTKKSEALKKEEEEERRAKRSYTSRYSARRSYTSKTAKFLSSNEHSNNWDSSDDENTFHVKRPTRKPMDEIDQTAADTPEMAEDDIHNDDDENQEQAMEDATADADLAERNEPEEDEASHEDSEPEAPKRKKLKRKRIEEDDSDDELFGAEMTTPNPQSRTVSPHTIARNRFQDDDEDDDENDVPETKKITIKKTKTVTPGGIAGFFKPTKKTNAPAKDVKETTPPPSVKRAASTSAYFLPKKTTMEASSRMEDPLEDSQSTVVPSQTPTVIASPVSTVIGEEVNTANSTPTRKIEFPKPFSSRKTIDEEDPLVESPPQSPRPYRRKPMMHKRTYGSSSQKKDKATRALELADVNHSPKQRTLALALSPGRSKFKRHWSPSRSPTRSPLASPSRLPMPDFRGIKNIGNTCYMNASLQMLFSVPSFLRQLTTSNEHSVVSSIIELFQELQLTKRAPASARNLKMAVDDKTNKFRGYQQRDANEFLGDLLDTMHDELVDAEKKEEKEKKTTYPTDNFFRLDVEVCLKCKSCGYTRTKEEMYRYLSLDIVQKEERPNIEECLEAFFQPEDREIKCEKCQDGLVAEQTMKVLSRPKAILLHLKRFAMVEQPRKDDDTPNFVLRKNKAAVELSKSLSLDPFVKGTAVASQNYKIQSIVHHIGSSADSGHYTADALRDDPKDKSTKTWVSFDDTLVERVSEADVLEDKPRRKTAYMMLYTLP